MMKSALPREIAASFRDPMNVVYLDQGVVYRKIKPSGFRDYDLLMSSGLCDALVAKKLLIPHVEVARNENEIIIKPEMVSFISYPYEWCFSQYQDAALLTLAIQKIALEYGMSLKDASAYNVQFHQGRPVFIDTMSFTMLNPEAPWAAYKQFCQHFLAPLALMSYVDLRLSKLMISHIDGIPLDLAAKLLPFKSKLNPGLYFHIHLHAKFQAKHNASEVSARAGTLSLFKLKALIDSMESATKKLSLKGIKTEWGDYYTFTNYSDLAFKQKQQIIESYIDIAKPSSLLDLGANDGRFTNLAAAKNIFCIASDVDPVAVEKCYQSVKAAKHSFLHPMILDLTNPSPAIGWQNHERNDLAPRLQMDCIMALALIHHLAISNNLPLHQIADYFSGLAEYLIIEFVPKSDSMVKTLLSTREDVFPSYTEAGFENAFLNKFAIIQKKSLMGSERILYLMRRIGSNA